MNGNDSRQFEQTEVSMSARLKCTRRKVIPTDVFRFQASRPSKKMRLSRPDGFDKPPVKSKSSGKVNVPEFVSAFGETSSTADSSMSKIPRIPTKSVNPPRPRALREFTSIASSTTSSKPSKLRVVKPLIPIVPTTAGETSASGAREISVLAQHHPVTTVPQEKHPGSVKNRLKFKVHTVPPQPKSKASVPISLMALPAIADQSRQKDSEMKTLSTTRVALATDPLSENGAVGLLSMLLQQHEHDLTDPADREMQRGLLQSPEKASKAKNSKYIRFVLLSCASVFILNKLP